MPLQTPIIIGVGDIKNRSTALASAKEPATLMLEAIHAALADASPSPSALLAAIDSIDVVRTWTWPYPDLPGLLASQLGVTPGVKWLRYSEHGGDKPGKLVDEAARRIARGEAAVCVVTGGEALASRALHSPARYPLCDMARSQAGSF
jgi:acetyl-CoA acetyltransferase